MATTLHSNGVNTPRIDEASGRPSEAGIGAVIRRSRVVAGMTQGELATALGVTYQQVQNYEKGSVRIAASTLKTIADLLDVPIVRFFQEPSARERLDAAR